MNTQLKKSNYLLFFLLLFFTHLLLAQNNENDFPAIALEISEDNMNKLRAKRKLALYQQGLGASSDDWVSATLTFDDKEHKAEVRLKGDMTDHWKDAKLWSFKVKLKGESTFMGMKRFALQHPQRRSYMCDWYYHQLFEHLDSSMVVINYDFVNLSLNGTKFPLYAIEENIDMKLIERNEQRAGVILKFDAERMMFIYENPGFNKSYLGTSPLVYQESKVKKSSSLNDQYYVARNLLEALRLGKLQTGQVFDLEKLALLFAVADLMGHHHSLPLHNIRFYYNPVTSLLEPVPYDNSKITKLKNLIGQTALTHLDIKMINWRPTLFNDDAFLAAYTDALVKLSKKKTLTNFFSSVEKQATYRTNALKAVYASYPANEQKVITNNQQRIIDILASIENSHFEIYVDKNAKDEENIKVQIKNNYVIPLIIKDIKIGDNVLKIADRRVIQCVNKQKPYAESSLKVTKGSLADIDWTQTAQVRFGLPNLEEVKSEEVMMQDLVQNEENEISNLTFMDKLLEKNDKPLS